MSEYLFIWYFRDGKSIKLRRDQIEYIDATETWWKPKAGAL